MRIIVMMALLTGCGGVKQATVSAADSLHLGDDWFRARALTLGISEDEARTRDSKLSEDAPPDGVWDGETSREAAVLWRDLCAGCHGPSGDPDQAPTKLDPSPRAWTGVGPAMGFFFGGDRMRAGIYRRIRDGGDSDGHASKMPAWGEQLAREQIWALVFHIEGF